LQLCTHIYTYLATLSEKYGFSLEKQWGKLVLNIEFDDFISTTYELLSYEDDRHSGAAT